jgi:hypothetical protein
MIRFKIKLNFFILNDINQKLYNDKMNNLPLPNELLRKIYQFIHPMFDYEKYITNMRNSNDIELDLCQICNDLGDLLQRGSSEIKQNAVDMLSATACLQSEYLYEVNYFLNKNNKFIRPGGRSALRKYYYKHQFDPEFTEQNAERLENNRIVERGLWENPDTDKELLYFHDIVEILHNGSLRDLIYACIVNKVDGFKHVTQKCRTNTFRSEKDIVKFIDRNYLSSNTDVGPSNKKRKRLPSRKSLVKKLMKI